MGTNWYIESGQEGVDHSVSLHIGKFQYENGCKHFVFYKSKAFQMERLLNLMNLSPTFAIDEQGVEKRPIEEMYDELLTIPFFFEQDFEFF